MKTSTRRFWQWTIGLLFIAAGTNHFIVPSPYLSMMPAWLPSPLLLVQISGVAEILGGAGLLISPVRRWAAWGLILLLIAVFPANFNVALNGWPGVNLPGWILWVRLPLQLVLIWCVYHICIPGSAGKAGAKRS